MFTAKHCGGQERWCPLAHLWISSRVRQPCIWIQRAQVVKIKLWLRLPLCWSVPGGLQLAVTVSQSGH